MSKVSEIIARAEQGAATIADGIYILDGLQRHADYLQDALDNLETRDTRVIIRIDGDKKNLRIKSIEDWEKGLSHVTE